MKTGESKPGKKNSKKRLNGCLLLLLNLVIMGVVLVALLFGVMWGLDAYTHHGEGIEVPELNGMNYTRAIEVANAKGLVLVANDSTYIKEMPAGCVVLQQPAAGSKVKEGRIVYVTINSLNLPRVAIPDLVDNSSYREAQAKLQALDFVVLPPKLVEGEKDWVYGIQCDGRSLRTGDMVAKESHLTLLIGNGLVGEDADIDYLLDSLGIGGGSHHGGDVDDMEEVLEIPVEENGGN